MRGMSHTSYHVARRKFRDQEHLKLLLSKEWLVKIDSEKSVSYLLVGFPDF